MARSTTKAAPTQPIPRWSWLGFISDDERWGEFSSKWDKAVRDEWGLSAWHQADYAARQEEFKDWPRDEESEKRLDYLLDLILGHTLGFVSIAFPRFIFDAYYASSKPIEGIYLATTLVTLIETYALPLPGPERRPVALVFESGAQGSHYVQRGFDSVPPPRGGERFRFVSLTFAGKHDFAGLQAADILAYETHRNVRRLVNKEKRRARYPLRKLLDSALPRIWLAVDPDYAENLNAFLGEGDGAV